MDRQHTTQAAGVPASEVRAAHDRLRAEMRRHDSMVVAFSGGVDSCVLACVAREVLGDRMVAVIASTPSLPGLEEREALDFLKERGIPFERIFTREMENEAYRSNRPDRCFHCKNELFERLGEVAESKGFSTVAYGANIDDGSDYRPGMSAAAGRGVLAPLIEAGLDKRTVRALARSLGLAVWDKPASPCLASRIPYFVEVTPERLSRIEAAERVLKGHGFKTARVRFHGDIARIEIPVEEHRRILDNDVRRAVARGVREAGFRYVTLDLEGFRSGRLNDVLEEE